MMNVELSKQITHLLMESYDKGVADTMSAAEEAIQKAVDVAIAAEREACAKVCASMVSNDADWDSHHWNQAVQRCEFAIRARGQV